MAVTVIEFLDRFVKFQGFKEEIIEQMLIESSLFFPTTQWNNEVLRDLAIQLLTAHNLEIEQQTIFDSGDRLLSQRNVAQPNLDDLKDYYLLTRYGIQLKELIDSQQLGMINI